MRIEIQDINEFYATVGKVAGEYDLFTDAELKTRSGSLLIISPTEILVSHSVARGAAVSYSMPFEDIKFFNTDKSKKYECKVI